MADSNHCQGKSHLGETQELSTLGPAKGILTWIIARFGTRKKKIEGESKASTCIFCSCSGELVNTRSF